MQGISDLITVPGLINLDFADVKTIMRNAGSAMMGIGRGTGENRAVEAAEAAISSPLLEETITGARGVILSVTGGDDMSLHEVHDAADVIYNAVDPEANIIFGSVIDENIKGEIRVTVIATGFKNNKPRLHVGQGAAASKSDSEKPDSRSESFSANPVVVEAKASSSQTASVSTHGAAAKEAGGGDEDEFDIPSFIRNREK